MNLPIIYLLACLLSSALCLHPYWRLAWSDEFNTLDTTKWNLRNMPGNYGNGEKQWYAPSQISVFNGSLVITAIKQAFGGQAYISGRMDTQDKAAFTYGRYEVRAKMAGGKGTWPAIWLLSQSKCWGLGAEIDIAEYRGAYPTSMGMFYHYANQCCAKFSKCITSKGAGHSLSVDFSADYHTYAVEWWSGNMTWFVDDQVIDSYQTSSLSVSQDLSPHFWIINNAIGGGYPGEPDNTTVFPNYQYVDYVRHYVWRSSCSGVTCSSHGCCNTSSFLCQCNAGYAGYNCEQNLGTAAHTFDAILSQDNIPNGWGNPYALYVTQNAVALNGDLQLIVSNSGCPSSCGNLPYSAGAWESIPRYSYGTFSYNARSSNVRGTGFSLTAAGEQQSLEQAAFIFTGGNSSFVSLWTWTNGWGFKHADIRLGFDSSSAFHTYSFKFSNTSIKWYIDGTQKYISTEVMPVATRLGPGAYYSAEPDWYGGPFTYTGPSYAYITDFKWTVASKTAQCK